MHSPPRRSPFGPQPFGLSTSRKGRMARLGGAPRPSHRHINRLVPRRNQELPKSQPGLTDFGKVLRKKHANNDAWLVRSASNRGRLRVNSQFMPISYLMNRSHATVVIGRNTECSPAARRIEFHLPILRRRFHHYGGATPAPLFRISHQHLRKGSLQCRRDHVCCRTLAQTKPVLDAVAPIVIGDADSMCRSCLHVIFPNRRHHRR